MILKCSSPVRGFLKTTLIHYLWSLTILRIVENRNNMKQRTTKPVLFLLSFFVFGTLYAQVPDGGIMLNAGTGTTYQKIGNCTVTEVTIDDQVFSRAIRVQTGANMTNAWDAQLKFPAVAGVAKNDVVLVAFYARTIASEEETGEGFLTACIEHNVSYTKQLYYKLSIGNQWKEYYAPVQIGATLAQSEISYLFHMGYPSQTVEVAEVRFLNYKDSLTVEDLPMTEITYVGQALDAAWRAPAAERIGQIRNGPADITVYNALGEPLEGAELHIEMVRHQFGFGTAVVANRIITNKVYRDTLFGLFNEVVFENDLKWPNFENTSTHGTISRALDTLEAHQVPVRGHNVIWPAYGYMPDFIEDLGNDAEAVRHSIDEHIDEVTTFTRGRLNDWDVLNEPYSEHDVQDMLGDEVMADWFKRTRRNDRGVKLYINDYSIISAGGRDKPHQDYLYNVIRYIDSLGGGIEGIGMQGHFSSELTSIERVYQILDRFAALDKEIKITEHDIDVIQRGVQADYTRDFMTIVFSHPAVKSLLVWGFWAGAHWKGEAAFFDLDWNIRPHGEVWKELIRKQWWTPPLDTVTDENGKLTFEGYLGTYSYTVGDGDTVRSGTFTLDYSNQSGISNSIVLSMDGSIPEKVRIIPAQEGFICEGEVMTLYAPEGDGLTYEWTLDGIARPEKTASITTLDSGIYRVTVSKNGISETSEPYLLEVREVPYPELAIGGELTFCEGETVSISVDPGKGFEYEWFKDGTRVQWGGTTLVAGQPGEYTLKTTQAGCTSVSEPVVLTLLSPTDPECATGIDFERSPARIFPNPCGRSARVELSAGAGPESTVELIDSRGMLRTVQQIKPGSPVLTLQVPGPGLYMVRIVQGESVQIHKLVAE
jgi:endo-1,4-beta-xylanase